MIRDNVKKKQSSTTSANQAIDILIAAGYKIALLDPSAPQTEAQKEAARHNYPGAKFYHLGAEFYHLGAEFSRNGKTVKLIFNENSAPEGATPPKRPREKTLYVPYKGMLSEQQATSLARLAQVQFNKASTPTAAPSLRTRAAKAAANAYIPEGQSDVPMEHALRVLEDVGYVRFTPATQAPNDPTVHLELAPDRRDGTREKTIFLQGDGAGTLVSNKALARLEHLAQVNFRTYFADQVRKTTQENRDEMKAMSSAAIARRKAAQAQAHATATHHFLEHGI